MTGQQTATADKLTVVTGQQTITTDMPTVVPRGEIPLSSSQNGDGLEVRAFDAHAALRAAVPRSVGMAWTCARAGQSLALRSHPWPSLLIVLHGKAQLAGATRRLVEQGDVVTLPAGHEYGLDVGGAGFRALHVLLREDDSDPFEASSLEQLLAHNEVRARMTLETPYFQLLRNGALASPQSRARLRDGIRVFSDAFQTVLFTRQATCKDIDYYDTFHGHLTEEIGHNLLLTVPEVRRAPADPALRATANWFSYQMLTLDNLGKAALVHLVLETAGFHFHTLAAPVLIGDVSEDYFHLHAEADDEHKDLVRRFLENLHPETYRRLHRIIDSGWDMFEAMTGRMVRLVEIERCS